MANKKFISMLLGLADASTLKRIAALLALTMTFEAGAAPLAQAAMIGQSMPVRSQIAAELPAQPALLSKVASAATAPFRVPAAIGSTVETFAPVSAGRLVYHIQDVHHHVGAQTNLSEIISRLASYAESQNKQLVVAVEGGAGKIETDSLASFPDDTVKREVSSALLRSGFLMGEEYAAIVNKPGRIKIVGIENPTLYDENVIARERSAASRERILATVREIKSQLVRLEQHNFSPTLLALESNRVAVEEGRMEMADYVSFLVSTDRALVSKYPMVSRMAALHDQEKSMDFSAVEKEGRRLVEQLVRQKSDKDVEKIMNDAVALREGRISPLAYYQSLLARSNGAYPALSSYVSYLRQAEKVEPDTLFVELQALESDMAKKLVRHPLAYELYKDVRWIECQERFFSLNMVPQEWQAQKSVDIAQIYRMHGQIRAFVAEQVDALGYRFATPPFSLSDLQVAYRGAADFYRAAEARDVAMEKTLLTVLDKHAKDGAIVAFIAGGFHTPGMTRQLRAGGIAYQVIRPQLEPGVELNKDLNYPDFHGQAELISDHANTDFLRPASELPRNAGYVAARMRNPAGVVVYPTGRTQAPFFSGSTISRAWKNAMGTGADRNGPNDFSIVAIGGIVALAITLFVGVVLIARIALRAIFSRSAKDNLEELRHDSSISATVDDVSITLDQTGLDVRTAAAKTPVPEPVLVRGGSGSGGSSGSAGSAPRIVIPAGRLASLPALKANLDAGVITDPEQLDVLRVLLKLNQDHLFQGWDEPGTNDDLKRAFLANAVALNHYYPGGLEGYRNRVIQLAQQAKEKFSTIAGKELRAPKGEELDGPTDPRFQELEEAGLKVANKTAWVLPAGGKGERLGLQDGIKPAVPLDLTTETPYMTEFIRSILAIQQKSNSLNNESIPATMMVMASPDNRDLMISLLSNPAVNQGMRVVEKTGDRFDVDNVIVPGEGKGTIYVLSQGKVPAVKSVTGDFYTDADNKYRIASAPHGHIDVHTLIHNSGLDDQWIAEGRENVVFIQDTNGPMRNTILTGIGAMVKNDLGFNFMVFTRKPKENYGLITEIREKDAEQKLVARANVEYVNAEVELKDVGGDVADAAGNSPFPGNPNQFIARLSDYRAALDNLAGLPELVSYAKLVAGTPTRVEGNMQDIVWKMDPSKVGTTKINPRYFIFAPAKNKISDAVKNEAAGKPAEGMQTAEAAYYQGQRYLLKSAGVKVDVDGKPVKFRGVTVPVGALVSLDPVFATTFGELKSKVSGNVSITDNSSLVIRGQNVRINGLKLDGALEINAAPGVEVSVEGLDVKNAGWKLVELNDEEINSPSVPEFLRIRGYHLVKVETAHYDITEPGRYVLDNNGLRRIDDTSVTQPFHWGASLGVGLLILALAALGAYNYNSFIGFVGLVGGLYTYFAYAGKVLSTPTVELTPGTDLAGLKNDDRFDLASVKAVEDFAAGLSTPEKPIKVELVPGGLAHVDREKGILYVGTGLLEASTGISSIGRALLLRAVLRHELIHFLPYVQFTIASDAPKTFLIQTGRLVNEIVAWFLGVAAFFAFAWMLPVSRVATADRPYTAPAVDNAASNLGQILDRFVAGMIKLFADHKDKQTKVDVPSYIAIDADSFPNLGAAPETEGAALSESDENFVKLLSNIHLAAAGTDEANADVAVYTTNNGDADRVARLQALVARANGAVRGVRFNLVVLDAPMVNVSALFGASAKNSTAANTVVFSGQALSLTGAHVELISGVPHLALATFAYSRYSDGKDVLKDLVNLFNELIPDFTSQATLNEAVTNQIIAAIQA